MRLGVVILVIWQLILAGPLNPARRGGLPPEMSRSPITGTGWFACGMNGRILGH
jgi:hypothetical protein